MINQFSIIYKYKKFDDNDFYTMREDLLPFSFGGNKVRKNEIYFEEILSGGYNHVVTYGSIESNHARIVANMSSINNLKCTIITPANGDFGSYNFDINKLLSANTIYTDVDNVKVTIDKTLNKLLNDGDTPYFIQGGGHGYLGTKAYVDTYQHILDYSKHHKIQFDYIFLASGTGATQAGLIIGNQLSKKESKIIGISVARSSTRGKSVIEESINEYYKVEAIHNPIPEINFYDAYTCGGYGKYNDEIKNLVKKYYIDYGIPLDTTYTGKAVYGMDNIIKDLKITNSNILFIHTGGTPLFFDYLREEI